MKTILTSLAILLTTTFFGQSTILTENFGNSSNTITCSSYNKWQNIANYKYKTGDISPEIKSDYKSSGYIGASGGGNLSFEGGMNQYLDIYGVNTMGYSYLAVSFYIIEVGGEVNGDEISILVSDNGGEFKKLNLGYDAIGTSYTRRLVENGVPNSKNLTIRILYTPSNKGVKIRIDDFKLLGCFTPSVPAVAYAPTACMFEVINLPSNTFIQTTANGTDVNPVGVILNSGNYYLRTVSTTMGCSSVWSQPVKFYVQVNKMPKITKNPTSSISVYNKSTEYKFIANADTTFFWEVSKNNGSTWEEIENISPYRINGDTLSISFTDEVKKFNGYQYRISTYGSTCNVSSTAGTLFIPESSTDNIVAFNAYEFFTVINVTWVTHKEKNIEQFVIERAVSDMKWEKIGSLVAMHNTDDNFTYSFYDNYPQQEMSFYRIKIVKEDNSTSYTPIIAVIRNTEKVNSKQYYSLLGEVVNSLEKDKYYIEVIDGSATRVVLAK
jgi:hypothetical protein